MKRPELRPQLESLPAKPGVYRFLGANDEVLYVGKAASLRNRVRSYFHDRAQYTPKHERLVQSIADIDWIVTRSELEALLLEMNLIKEHRPHYNVVLKDDKRYPYIRVTWSDAFPRVTSTRHVEDAGDRYFGPYSSAAAMYETLHALRKVFPYVDCERTISGRDARACLYKDLGLCPAPCVGAITHDEYRESMSRLCRFLRGDAEPVLAALRAQMREHAERLEFEQAARMRDRIAACEVVIERQRVIAPSLTDQDVIAVARDEGTAVVQVFFVRNGKLLGREYFWLAGTDDEPDPEVLASFLKQFYDEGALVPGEIVVPEHPAEAEIIERWLAGKRGTKVRIAVPRRGQKRALVDVAVENAAETLRVLKIQHGQETRGDLADQALGELQEALGLPAPPARMECFDISNLQGTNTVGSMVVFVHAAPCKADYRRFRIRLAGGGDDFAAMAEMLGRRFQHLADYRSGAGETPARAPGSHDDGRTAFEKTPDLVVVDGGKGQLGVASRILQGLGLDDIAVAALAKREEVLFRPGASEPIALARDSQALYLIQRLRDEAHRFAVTFHRSVRDKGSLRSTLDGVPGIGSKRRRALLVHFGSLDRIRLASVDELASVPGMNRLAAEQVKAHL